MGEKVMGLAAKWKENGGTHVESTGCHSGLLSEGHRQCTKLKKLNGIIAANSLLVFAANRNKFQEKKNTDPTF